MTLYGSDGALGRSDLRSRGKHIARAPSVQLKFVQVLGSMIFVTTPRGDLWARAKRRSPSKLKTGSGPKPALDVLMFWEVL